MQQKRYIKNRKNQQNKINWCSDFEILHDNGRHRWKGSYSRPMRWRVGNSRVFWRDPRKSRVFWRELSASPLRPFRRCPDHFEVGHLDLIIDRMNKWCGSWSPIYIFPARRASTLTACGRRRPSPSPGSASCNLHPLAWRGPAWGICVGVLDHKIRNAQCT